jgi:hypothetical protein
VDQSASKASLHFDYCLAGGNSLCPDLMTAEERLSEVAQLLAIGLLRLRRQESARHVSHLEKKRLDFSPHGSVHATARQRRGARR